VASLLPAGSISYLGYGSKMLEVLMRMVPMAVALGALPVLSRLAASGDEGRLRSTTLSGLRWAVLGAVPLALTVLVFRAQIVRVLFQRGAFDAEATRNVALACAWYAVGYVPATVSYVLGYALLAARKVRFLAGLGSATLVLTAALDVAFTRAWGFVGVAIAFLVVSMVQVVVLGAHFQFRGRTFSGAQSLPFLAQLGGASLAMAAVWVAVWPLTSAWSERVPAVWLAVNAGGGLAVFLLALWWVGNADLRTAVRSLVESARGTARGARGENG
jgi:putative peptidoglycan lipid II flippase